MAGLIIITNLYPSSWDPNRATFNKQQFQRLAKRLPLKILVPVAWPQWFKLSKTQKREGGEQVRYRPFFYTPKVAYPFFSVFMLYSLLFTSLGWIRRQRPDALFASWAYPEGVATAMLAKFLGCPFFIKVHGSDVNDFAKDKWRAKQIVWAAKRAAKVFVVSNALRQKLITMGVPEDNISLVYNGVDQDVFYLDKGDEKPSNQLLYVGNLKANKGVMELVKSYCQLIQSEPDAELVIAGQGAMEATMREYLQQHSASGKVRFLGSISHQQVADEIRASRFVVLPSYAEGVPNILLEAMACGKPVVATNVGGIPEIVSEQTSILVPPQTIEPLTQALQNAWQRNWSSPQIAEHAKQFDWSKNIQQVEQVIQKALNKDEDKSVVSI